MAQLFKNKRVLITGASAGIGAAVAREFARQGAKVAILARRRDRLEKVAAAIRAEGGEVLVVPGDVTQRESIERAVQETVAAFGGLDVVLANAGFGVVGRINRLTSGDFRRQFDTNFFGVVDTILAVLPHLRASRGRLGVMSSVMGYAASPTCGAYCTSKFAVYGLAETLYYELAEDDVSVTCISPGFVESEFRSTDNDGVYHSDWPDPAPAWLRMPAEKAARQIARALYRRKFSVVLTRHGKAMVWMQRHFPRLLRTVTYHATKGKLDVAGKAERGGFA